MLAAIITGTVTTTKIINCHADFQIGFLDIFILPCTVRSSVVDPNSFFSNSDPKIFFSDTDSVP
jgi:hypothetical protein